MDDGRALSRATSSDRIGYLLADEVRFGKAIEVDLIMRELKLHTSNGYDEVKRWFVKIGNKENLEVFHV